PSGRGRHSYGHYHSGQSQRVVAVECRTPCWYRAPVVRLEGALGLGFGSGREDLTGRKDYAVLAFGLHQAALELLLVQLGVQSALLQQLPVRSPLDEAPAVHHEDDV